MTTTQKCAVTALAALAVGTGVFEAHRVGQIRASLQEAEGQLKPLTEEVDQLRQERDQGAVTLQTAQVQLQDQVAELVRLRGEVTRLRGDAQELARLKAQLAANAPQSQPVTSAPPTEPVPAELAARITLKPVLRDKAEARVDPIYDASLMVSVKGIGGGGGRNTILPSGGSGAASGMVTTTTTESTTYEGPAQPAAKSDGMSAPRP